LVAISTTQKQEENINIQLILFAKWIGLNINAAKTKAMAVNTKMTEPITIDDRKILIHIRAF
jgi:hypothetical protein